ncbi:MAG: hypothetical protein GY789_17470 [Hyphomicrobiales bacterium]|nr:hypothetical protein [Hyphomicrobiales bacterium]
MSDDNQERVYEGVTKDPLDLRDLMYEGSLSELPFEIDNRSRVPIVLDQGKEGACTGFGLAIYVPRWLRRVFLLATHFSTHFNRVQVRPPTARI